MNTNRNELKGANALVDLDVDRVDAVDKPATGRAFLLFKSEAEVPAVQLESEAEALREKAEALRTKAKVARGGTPDTEPVGKSRLKEGASRGGLFADLLLGPEVEAEVRKGAIREYTPNELARRGKGGVETPDTSAEDREAERFAQSLYAMAGKGQDATRRPLWGRDSFLHGDMHGGTADAFEGVTAHSNVNDSDATRIERRPDGLNFAAPGDHGMPDGNGFRAPQPGRLRRVGDFYVQRRGEEVVAVDWHTAALMRSCGYEVAVEKSAREEKPAPETDSFGRAPRFSVSFGNLLG